MHSNMYTSLLKAVRERELELDRVPPSTAKSPYAFYTFGIRGSGKSSFLNTVAQVVRDSDILENIATSCLRPGENGGEGTYESVIYNIKKNYLYIIDTPGVTIRRPRPDEIDLKSATEDLSKRIEAARVVCGSYPSLECVIPGVAILVCDARYYSEGADVATQKLLMALLDYVRKSVDVVVALTHWDIIMGENKTKEVFNRAVTSLQLDAGNVFCITNYVGKTTDEKHTLVRNYDQEEHILRLLNCAMGRMDQAHDNINRIMQENKRVVVLEARYFAQKKPVLEKDVTSLVQRKISDGKLAFKICNKELDGDPARGYDKYFHISYTYLNIKYVKKYAERDYIYLP